eukprot:Amastigsp_a184272_6.p5 type:complete len:112 gc:universal Amastigsp_a184272_6:920-585(-)
MRVHHGRQHTVEQRDRLLVVGGDKVCGGRLARRNGRVTAEKSMNGRRARSAEERATRAAPNRGLGHCFRSSAFMSSRATRRDPWPRVASKGLKRFDEGEVANSGSHRCSGW